MSTTYSLTGMKQLVDLNGESVNFSLTFKVSSIDRSNFDAIVMNQTMLDSTDNIEYKQSRDGIFSGKITSDDNTYDNYFLVLRANPPCDVAVDIEKRDIKSSVDPKGIITNRKPAVAPKRSLVKPILLLIVIVGGAALLYYMYKRSERKKVSGDAPPPLLELAPVVTQVAPVVLPPHFSPPAPVVRSPVAPVVAFVEAAVSTPAPVISAPVVSAPVVKINPLLARLKNLNIQ